MTRWRCPEKPDPSFSLPKENLQACWFPVFGDRTTGLWLAYLKTLCITVHHPTSGTTSPCSLQRSLRPPLHSLIHRQSKQGTASPRSHSDRARAMHSAGLEDLDLAVGRKTNKEADSGRAAMDTGRTFCWTLCSRSDYTWRKPSNELQTYHVQSGE